MTEQGQNCNSHKAAQKVRPIRPRPVSVFILYARKDLDLANGYITYIRKKTRDNTHLSFRHSLLPNRRCQQQNPKRVMRIFLFEKFVLTLEELLGATKFNDRLRALISESGR